MSSLFSLVGKNAAVVGGGSGIGQAAAIGLAEHGAFVTCLDVNLDGATETAARIRDRFDIPVVYLTAYADDQTVQRAKRTEPFGYILKPIVDSQLQTTIEIALHKHRMEHTIRQNEKWLSSTLRCVGDAVLTTDDSRVGWLRA